MCRPTKCLLCNGFDILSLAGCDIRSASDLFCEVLISEEGKRLDTRGRHLLLELWKCQRGTNDPHLVQQAIVDAVDAARATVVHLHVHRFEPQGVTGIAVLSESHLSIHTWPEREYVAADIFTCGNTAQPQLAIAVLQQAFEAEQVDCRWVLRGIPKGIEADLAVRHDHSTQQLVF